MNAQTSGLRYAHRHPWYRLGVVLMISSLSLGVPGVIVHAVAQTDTTEDPAIDYTVWRDDEIFVAPPAAGGLLEPSTYEYVAPNLAPRAPCTANSVHGVQAAAASGHVATPERENIVVVRPYTNDPVTDRLWVGFADQLQPGCTEALSPATALGPSTTPDIIPSTPALSPRWTANYVLPYSYDVAVGDLDRRIDLNGDYRDEVVVAYASPGTSASSLTVTVAVVDYTDSFASPLVYPTVVTASTPAKLDMTAIGSYVPNAVSTVPLAVTTGDFNGDGRREIGVAYLSSATQVSVAILAYGTTETEGIVSHSLAVKSAMTSTGTIVNPWIIGEVMFGFTPQHWMRGFDVAAGDFDGNGRDELVVAASVYGVSRDGWNQPAGAIDFKVFHTTADAATTVSLANGQLKYVSYSTDYTTVPAQPLELHLATGLFKYDATTGNLDVSQLALAWTDTYMMSPRVATLGYSSALALTEFGRSVFASYSWPTIGIGAGGLTGLRQSTGNPSDVLSSIVLALWNYNDGYKVALYVPDATSGAPVYTTSVLASTIGNYNTSSIVVPAVAYDRDGDSLYLGAPVHMTVEDVTQTQAIIQEPPKHAYWDKQANKVSVITRYDSTYAELKTDNSESFETSTKSTSDFSAGASASTSAKETVEWPGPLNSASVSASVKATFGYDYSYHEEGYNSANATLKYMAAIATSLDDAVAYTSTTIDIWRYRVYGAEPIDENGKPIDGYSFVDIALPRGTPTQTMLGGLSVSSWYQPLHENGNILSYPVSLGDGQSGYGQPDMGPVRLPCPSVEKEGCIEDENHMWWLEKLAPLGTFSGALDGTSTEQTVSMATADGDSQQTQYTHKLSGSVDTSVSASLKVMGISTTSVETQVGFHAGGSWGELDTAKTTTDATKGVRLVLGPQVPRLGYNYDSVLYVTTDGTWKLAFSADPLGNDTGQIDWKDMYDDGPDPALNLPVRFDPAWNSNVKQYDYVPVTTATRQKLRGFFVRQSTVDPVTGEYPLLGRAVEAGETVRLEVRVNNYTLADDGAVDGLVVAFKAVSTDAQGNPIEVPIGETTIPHLGERQIEVAAIDWDTDDERIYGTPGASRTWRIWVELDPDNAIPNELYETESPSYLPYCAGTVCVDPGQNNEGWADVVVHTPVATGPSGPPAYWLEKGLMAALAQNGKLKTRGVLAPFGRPLEVRVVVTAEVPGTSYRTLRLYDGNPDEDGVLVGEEKVHVGDLAGATAWFRWMPQQAGEHVLHAVMVPYDDDVTVPDDYATLKVMVHPEKKNKNKNKKR